MSYPTTSVKFPRRKSYLTPKHPSPSLVLCLWDSGFLFNASRSTGPSFVATPSPSSKSHSVFMQDRVVYGVWNKEVENLYFYHCDLFFYTQFYNRELLTIDKNSNNNKTLWSLFLLLQTSMNLHPFTYLVRPFIRTKLNRPYIAHTHARTEGSLYLTGYSFTGFSCLDVHYLVVSGPTRIPSLVSTKMGLTFRLTVSLLVFTRKTR